MKSQLFKLSQAVDFLGGLGGGDGGGAGREGDEVVWGRKVLQFSFPQ